LNECILSGLEQAVRSDTWTGASFQMYIHFKQGVIKLVLHLQCLLFTFLIINGVFILPRLQGNAVIPNSTSYSVN